MQALEIDAHFWSECAAAPRAGIEMQAKLLMGREQFRATIHFLVEVHLLVVEIQHPRFNPQLVAEQRFVLKREVGFERDPRVVGAPGVFGTHADGDREPLAGVVKGLQIKSHVHVFVVIEPVATDGHAILAQAIVWKRHAHPLAADVAAILPERSPLINQSVGGTRAGRRHRQRLKAAVTVSDDRGMDCLG